MEQLSLLCLHTYKTMVNKMKKKHFFYSDMLVWSELTEAYRHNFVFLPDASDTDHCQPSRPRTQDCGECWTLLFSLCPVSAVLSSLISALVAYHLCRKKGNSAFKLEVLISAIFWIMNPHTSLTMRLFLFLQLKALKLMSKNLKVDVKQNQIR